MNSTETPPRLCSVGRVEKDGTVGFQWPSRWLRDAKWVETGVLEIELVQSLGRDHMLLIEPGHGFQSGYMHNRGTSIRVVTIERRTGRAAVQADRDIDLALYESGRDK